MTLDEILGRTRELAHDVIAGHAERVDTERRWPAENMAALQQAGLGGLVVPVECGGLGQRLLALARVCELLAHSCPSTAISYGMHCVASAVIAARATDEQKARYLVPIAEGRHLTTLALSEPGTGANFYIPESTLTKAPNGGYRVRGQKSFVTNGGHADSYVISTAAGEPTAGPGEFSLLVLDADAPGASWGEPWVGWGMRGNSARNLVLDDVPIPGSGLLGQEGDEIWYVFNVVAPYFITAMAATYLGVASAALRELKAHLVERTHSHEGRAVAHLPIVQHRVGELWARVERTRALIYRASTLADDGAPDALPALCAAKAEVAESAERAIADAMSLMGGRAYAGSSRIQRLYRDVRAAHVMAPTTDVLRQWTGRAFLELPLLQG